MKWRTLGFLHVNVFELLGNGISLQVKSEFERALRSIYAFVAKR